MFFFVWFFIPETKGISLEAMDRLFGVTDAPEKALVEEDAHHSNGSNGNGEHQDKKTPEKGASTQIETVS